MTQDYKLHKHNDNFSTIFIKGNSIYGHYMVHGDKVSKVVQHFSGDEIVEPFHTIGDIPLNTESILLNELREKGKL